LPQTEEQRAKRIAALKNRASQEVVDKRVAAIYSLMQDGQRRYVDLVRAIALRVRDEEERRESSDPRVKANFDPIWFGVVPPKRTIQHYKKRARERFESEGAQLPTQGKFILGMQMARISDLYFRALAKGNYHVCARLIEEVNEMFGIRGAIVLRITEDEGKSDAELPMATMTGAEAMDEFTRFARMIEQRKLRAAERQEIGGNGDETEQLAGGGNGA
jgi:hypothetical protein